MAMSHESCAHPRTPAGRAACRKAGTATSGQHVVVKEKKAPVPKKIKKAVTSVPDIPYVFNSIVHHALHVMGWTVSAGTPYHAAKRVIVITSEYGCARLVWRCTLPHGISEISFTPVDGGETSVPSLNEAIRMLEDS